MVSQSCFSGKSGTTEQVAKRLAVESTVSPADVRAVLTALGGVMGDFMAQGRSVKLDGVGSFYFTASTVSNGVATEKEVSANQIKGVRVRFIPETRYRGAGKGRVSTRGLSDVDIEGNEWKGEEKGWRRWRAGSPVGLNISINSSALVLQRNKGVGFTVSMA